MCGAWPCRASRSTGADRAFEAFPTVLDTIADVAGIRQPKAPPAETADGGEGDEGGAHDDDEDEGHDEGEAHDDEDEGHDEDDAHDDDEEGHDEDEAHDDDEEEWVEPEARRFEAGSFVVVVAQASRAALMDLLEPRFLPVRNFYPDGPFLRMYDAAAYTMAMQMGVEAVRVEEPFDVSLTRVTEVPSLTISAPDRASSWYALTSEVNQSYRVANDLMEAGFTVHRADEAVTLRGQDVRGAFLIPAGQSGLEAALENLAVGVPVFSDPPDIASTRRIEASRISLYRGWAGSMDEGWTRLLLEEFGFSFQSLSNDDVRESDLRSRLDVIMIPSEISVDRLVDGHDEEDMPAGYTGGIGDEGVENLQAFVRAGGTLVTLERGDQVVLDRFDVPIRNALEDVSSDEFFLPASLLRMETVARSRAFCGQPVHRPGQVGRRSGLRADGMGGRVRDGTGGRQVGLRSWRCPRGGPAGGRRVPGRQGRSARCRVRERPDSHVRIPGAAPHADPRDVPVALQCVLQRGTAGGVGGGILTGVERPEAIGTRHLRSGKH